MTLDSIAKSFNSPFCVTLLGGALAAVITSMWQSNAAHNAYQRTVLEHELQDRRLTAKEFADSFGGALYTFDDFLTRRLWIKAHSGERSHVYPDGRNLVSERTYFESICAKTFSRPTPESMTARVAMTFSSRRVQLSVLQLKTVLNKMVFDNDPQALRADFTAANRYDELMSDMQAEITSFEDRWETAK
jgi:hypothetical protein